MIKLYKQTTGAAMLLAIAGDFKQEIIDQYNSCYNRECTNGQLHWINDPILAYICTTKEKLDRYLINSSMAIILNATPDRFKGKKKGAEPLAKVMATERFANIEEMEILPLVDQQNEHFYRLVGVNAEVFARKSEERAERHQLPATI